MMKDKGHFKPRARLLIQLGDQLIRNENIAIVELVKNSYDADAKNCNIICEHIDSETKGSITIEDDGMGMTPEVVQNVWLEPGADFKQQIIDKGFQASFDFDTNLALPKRAPIGEKGVGRFGVHKLGSKIEVVTKSAQSNKEVVIRINWDEFSKEKYLDEADFPVEERSPVVFKGKTTGTKIIITSLRYHWDEKTYQELTRNINSLKSPFQGTDEFNINQKLTLESKKDVSRWESSKIEVEDIRKAALWEVKCSIEAGKITDFTMSFKPWKDLGIDSRVVTLDDLKANNRDLLKQSIDDATEKGLNILSAGIGRIDFVAYVYDLDQKTLAFNPVESKTLRKYLVENGGVRVYRDNFRVYDYGEPGNDWLALDNSRINNPSKLIGNKNIVGAIMLDRRGSLGLVEKTNREGFVENQSYKLFLAAIQYLVALIGSERGIDKSKIRKQEKDGTKNSVSPVNYELSSLKEKVVDRISTVDMKDRELFIKDITEDFDRIQEQYVKTSEILVKSSNMGLTFGVVVHEVDKRLARVKYLLNNEHAEINTKELKEQVNGIVQLVEGYAAISATDKKINSFKKTIDIALLNTEFRFSAHNIEVIEAYKSASDAKARFSLNSIVGVLLNVFDNSIYWLEQYKVENPKIFVTVKHYDDGVGIILADNGKGFTISFEDAIKPYATQKVVGGHGLGLHIASEVMRAQNGSLNQIKSSDIKGLPEEFRDGAILELLFKV